MHLVLISLMNSAFNVSILIAIRNAHDVRPSIRLLPEVGVGDRNWYEGTPNPEVLGYLVVGYVSYRCYVQRQNVVSRTTKQCYRFSFDSKVDTRTFWRTMGSCHGRVKINALARKLLIFWYMKNFILRNRNISTESISGTVSIEIFQVCLFLKFLLSLYTECLIYILPNNVDILYDQKARNKWFLNIFLQKLPETSSYSITSNFPET